MKARLWVLIAVLAAAGCAAQRGAVPEEDLLPGVPKALTKTVVAKYFEFKVLLAGWEGPRIIPGGMRFASQGDCASLEIAYHKKGGEHWVEPAECRKKMRLLGAVEDSGILEPIRVSGRFASRVRYTTYEYGGTDLFGQSRRSFRHEEVLVPVTDGNYVMGFRSCEEQFALQQSRYLQFLDSVKLLQEGEYQPEEYYLNRRELAVEEFGPPAGAAGSGALEHILD